ncbi:MAG TPA: hypothetical protein EYP14_10700 [Planctomycetaceae bacterium]|nr:hypothetical protein [Planctomycetaceae bacterium]
MRTRLSCVFVVWTAWMSAGRLDAAQTYLVRDGRPNAEIVVAPDAPRTTRLAAAELQKYMAKISGATVPIVTQPTHEGRVRIYVGRSRDTDELGVRNDDLPDGAYRIVSGKNWLVLIGTDTDFVPTEPWPRSHQDRVSGRLIRAWDAVTGKRWGNPVWHLYKFYSGRASAFGKPGKGTKPRLAPVDVWAFDERGSFNAVCGFLRRLGVRCTCRASWAKWSLRCARSRCRRSMRR